VRPQRGRSEGRTLCVRLGQGIPLPLPIGLPIPERGEVPEGRRFSDEQELVPPW
jgi:hypothetical protein